MALTVHVSATMLFQGLCMAHVCDIPQFPMPFSLVLKEGLVVQILVQTSVLFFVSFLLV